METDPIASRKTRLVPIAGAEFLPIARVFEVAIEELVEVLEE